MPLSEYLIIDEDNWRDHVAPDGEVLPEDHPHSGGEKRFMGCKPRSSAPGSLLYAAAPSFAIIPRADWSSRIRDLDASKSTLRVANESMIASSGTRTPDGARRQLALRRA